MTNFKDILVTTASGLTGMEIKRHIKPLSAHVVAGTNLFSDFFASFTDVFGGRSQTYQKQLTSLYNEAIERLRISAYEIGANAVIGLHVDLDEISGKGKSMFMVTAIGTAVVVNMPSSRQENSVMNEKYENVSVDRIISLQKRRAIISQAETGELVLDDSKWDFIISNQVDEIYDYILTQFVKVLNRSNESPEGLEKFKKLLLSYLDSLPEQKRVELLYGTISNNGNDILVASISGLIKDLNLLDFGRVMAVMNFEDFSIRKRALRILSYHKSFYSKEDVSTLLAIIEMIKSRFPERGPRSWKKPLLSSKEKEVWTCTCKNVIEIGKYCGGCKTDMYGLLPDDRNPIETVVGLEEKISLIEAYVK